MEGQLHGLWLSHFCGFIQVIWSSYSYLLKVNTSFCFSKFITTLRWLNKHKMFLLQKLLPLWCVSSFQQTISRYCQMTPCDDLIISSNENRVESNHRSKDSDIVHDIVLWNDIMSWWHIFTRWRFDVGGWKALLYNLCLYTTRSFFRLRCVGKGKVGGVYYTVISNQANWYLYRLAHKLPSTLKRRDVWHKTQKSFSTPERNNKNCFFLTL